MSASNESLPNLIHFLPAYSLIDTMLHAIRGDTPNTDPTNATRIKIERCTRAAFAYYISSRIWDCTVRINLSIGVVHLLCGLALRFKSNEKEITENNEKWKSIARHVHKGCSHLLIGCYDYALGYLLQQKYLTTIALGALVIAPDACLFAHHKVFKKPSDTSLTEEQVCSSLLAIFAQSSIAQFPTVFGANFESLKPPPPSQNTQSEKPREESLGGTYLNGECMISSGAQELTTILMPAQNKSNVENVKPPRFSGLIQALEWIVNFLKSK